MHCVLTTPDRIKTPRKHDVLSVGVATTYALTICKQLNELIQVGYALPLG